MSVCGGCPYPYEMVLSGEADSVADVCDYGCTHEDAAYRISWAYDQLRERYEELNKKYNELWEKYTMSQKIDKFDGTEHAFLSNFYSSPIIYEGIVYPTVEHMFQAMKTLDLMQRQKIANAATPGAAKRMGRQVALRGDWEEVKVDVMRTALQLKFSQPQLKEKLLATGDAELIEGNTWNDRFWGVCNGTGRNMLGTLLMELRRELKEAQ